MSDNVNPFAGIEADSLTACVHAPQISRTGFKAVSVATERASTIIFPDADAYARRNDGGLEAYSYGLHGTPTRRTLEAQIAQLEGGRHALVTPSGLSAITLTMLAILSPGDTVLIPDSVYPPVRDFADGHLKRQGVTVRYYDPCIGGEIIRLLDPTVKLVHTESPGSTSMEIQDLPAIAEAAHSIGALVSCDNSWATPLYFRPLEAGADISLEAVTKYMAGHSDLLMGSVSVSDTELYKRVVQSAKHIGFGVSPDDCGLALRGLQTLALRLDHAARTGLALAQALQGREEIAEVFHPALPQFPGHSIWQRDFSGASGVFSAIVADELIDRVPGALDSMEIFAIGASWGGTHSLVAPMDLVSGQRSATAWPYNGPVIRFSVGAENPLALEADLMRFCDALGKS